jgi:hypothetical protein
MMAEAVLEGKARRGEETEPDTAELEAAMSSDEQAPAEASAEPEVKANEEPAAETAPAAEEPAAE